MTTPTFNSYIRPYNAAIAAVKYEVNPKCAASRKRREAMRRIEVRNELKDLRLKLGDSDLYSDVLL